MSTRAQVSVVIPARNAAATIEDQLTALSGQRTERPFEVLVVDDASEDATSELVDAWADRDHRFRRLTTDGRRGAGHARNLGTSWAAGSIIAYCDADDVASPDWLEGLVRALDSFAIVGGPLDHRSLNPPDIRIWRAARPMTALPNTHGFLDYAVSANCALWRGWWERVGGWDESLANGEDVELSWRIQLAGGTLGFAPEAVVHYRHRPTPMGVARQAAAYSRAEVALLRRFAPHGARRCPARSRGARLGYLVTRLPYLALGRRRQGMWLVVAGGLLGELRGSLDRRMVDP